jgi:shikimate kinase
LDELVRTRFGGASISEIWRLHGEGAFRAAEGEVLESLLEQPSASATAPQHGVIALGGGTPTVDRARRAIERARREDRARIVLLMAPPELLAQRLRDDALGQGRSVDRHSQQRPSLTGAAPSEEVAALLAIRLPLYRQLADLEVHSTEGAPEAVARRVIQALRGAGAS